MCSRWGWPAGLGAAAHISCIFLAQVLHASPRGRKFWTDFEQTCRPLQGSSARWQRTFCRARLHMIRVCRPLFMRVRSCILGREKNKGTRQRNSCGFACRRSSAAGASKHVRIPKERIQSKMSPSRGCWRRRSLSFQLQQQDSSRISFEFNLLILCPSRCTSALCTTLIIREIRHFIPIKPNLIRNSFQECEREEKGKKKRTNGLLFCCGLLLSSPYSLPRRISF